MNKTPINKELLFLICELLTLIIGPLFLLLLPTSNITSGIIISFVVAFSIIFFTLFIDEIKKKEDPRYYLPDMTEEQIEKFKTRMNAFVYEESPDYLKMEYMIYSLFLASEISDCLYFYQRCQKYSKEEQIEIFNKLKVTKDLELFFKNVIINKKITKSIYRFEAELWGMILFFAELQPENDPLIFDEKVFYDYTKHKRYYVVFNKENNDYQISCEEFSMGRWNSLIMNSMYDTYETAYKECKFYFEREEKLTNQNDFFEEKELGKDAENLLKLFEEYTKILQEDKYFFLIDYYCSVIDNNHKWFFKYRNITKYLETLKEFLPQALFDSIMKITTEDYKEYCYKETDEIFLHNKENIKQILQKYANELYN